MKHRVGLLTAFVATGFVFAATSRADLNGDVKQILQDKLLKSADVGVELAHLETDGSKCTPIFRFESDQPLTPASNLKLVTTSAILDRLGPEFNFQTALVKRGDDLILVGDGDPTFGDAVLLKKYNWNTTTVFEKWAGVLKNAKISTVRNVLVDDSIFDQQFVHANWPKDHNQSETSYAAGVAGMNINANCLDFYIEPTSYGQPVSYIADPAVDPKLITNTCISGGNASAWFLRDPQTNDITIKGSTSDRNVDPISIPMRDPALFAASALAEVLKKQQIMVTGTVGRDRTVRAAMKLPSADMAVLAIHTTPLGSAMARANKDSMNIYAEACCKRLGAASSGESGSWVNGVAALQAFLTKAQVAPTQYKLDDGCGLSHENKISPDALIRVLTYDFFNKNRQAFMDSMGVAGVDGRYLAARFAGTDLRGRVWLKSGYVNNVSGISGYLHAKDDQWYAFSILMNGIPNGANAGAKQLQERIVKALDSNVSTLASAADR